MKNELGEQGSDEGRKVQNNKTHKEKESQRRAAWRGVVFGDGTVSGSSPETKTLDIQDLSREGYVPGEGANEEQATAHKD